MDATTMPSMTSLFKQLQKDYPNFIFEKSNEFWWSAGDNTIHIDVTATDSQAFTLHELSHAILGHRGYVYDVDLIKLERDAWHHATAKLMKHYAVAINEQLVQDNLDTYREWLHARSTCPECEATGIQAKDSTYRCLGCGAQWRTNEARICALRRYTLHTK